MTETETCKNAEVETPPEVCVETWKAYLTSSRIIKWTYIKIKFPQTGQCYRKVVLVTDEDGKYYKDLPNEAEQVPLSHDCMNDPMILVNTKQFVKRFTMDGASRDKILKDFATGSVEMLPVELFEKMNYI